MLRNNRPLKCDGLSNQVGVSHFIWSFWSLLLFLVTLAHCMTDEGVGNLRQETRNIFYHGFDNYMEHAFPADELRPVTCGPLTRDRANPAHIELNDVLGNYSLTLVDSLSTLAILASSPPEKTDGRNPLKDFQDGIAALVQLYGDGRDGPSGQGLRARGFDLDSKVQLFETNIRGLGGLLSAHLFATGELPITGYDSKVQTKRGRTGIFWPNGFVYDGQLLRLALDLGKRLLPAFNTPTGIPYPRINLRYGIPFYATSSVSTDQEHGQCLNTPDPSTGNPEITETCSAGAGSLILEFATLSRLTGDPQFENVAKRAFWAIWERRSMHGLIGADIDSETGQWIGPYTGVGAGIDSFFEYAFKSHILLSGLPYNSGTRDDNDPDAFLSVWKDAHAAIHRHVYRGAAFGHPHYIQVDLYTGATRAHWIDSLSAYFPGLLTLAGELEEAIETHLLYAALWTRYSALPERWSTATGTIEHGLRWWGGRPEFVESTWYIYRATNDPYYLHIGEMVLRDIKRRCWTACGWAGLQDVQSGEKTDRMESFFLGETAKYLHLLFDPTHPLNKLDAPFVMTTEGHPLIIPKYFRNPEVSTISNMTRVSRKRRTKVYEKVCPVPPPTVPFTVSATAARQDIFHAANLVRLYKTPKSIDVEGPLVDFTSQHPSITAADLSSPSNYTYYPWTLPLNLVPQNATSAKLALRTTLDVSFPSQTDGPLNIGGVQRLTNGILVNSMNGLRLGMILEPDSIKATGEIALNQFFRIHSVSNVPLGRDEKVFLERESVADFNPLDPYFTRVRDMQSLDIVLDMEPNILSSIPTSAKKAVEDLLSSVNGSTLSLDLDDLSFVGEGGEDGTRSMFDSLLTKIQNILSTDSVFVRDSNILADNSAGHGLSFERTHMEASLPAGPGAAPIPDIDEEPTLTRTSSSSEKMENSDLPWDKIYVTHDHLCGPTLPAHIPRENQILVITRGSCSFSEKLQNIPSYPPSSSSLQLVIVVSYDVDEDGDPRLIQPLLDKQQTLTSGLARQNPIPLVMVGGGDKTMDLLKRTKGLGIRRRWSVLSQGVKIGNLIVL
ncbi:glycoside hydrolase family 47 protein [Patellaria atrata CBS 101060]|uniref:alpha-1,2-Mannosidase n=1 Tax=Patellaria atrata CBS 101060 TaxID=1346257 RepID=A0A9P4SEU3_9PEZI|nr:glycoside hydrolase family 47 protein [Patellaria atrata CBS 101060]